MIWFAVNFVLCLASPMIVGASYLEQSHTHNSTPHYCLIGAVSAQWLGHMVIMCMNSQLYVVDYPIVADQDLDEQKASTVTDAALLAAGLGPEPNKIHKKSAHYLPLRKKFNDSHIFVWILQAVLGVGAIVIYILYFGYSDLFDYWILIDTLISIALFGFYKYQQNMAQK